MWLGVTNSAYAPVQATLASGRYRGMTIDTLIGALPDLVMLVRRDGVILSAIGGRGVALPSVADAAGKRLEAIWPESVAEVVKHLTRRAITMRAAAQVRFEQDGERYEVRASAHGPDRAICVIRTVFNDGARQDTFTATGELLPAQLDRREFIRRFRETMSLAAIREKPTAVSIIYLDGVADIARSVDANVSERVLSAAIMRVPQESSRTADEECPWYLGQLSEHILALAIETANRDTIETCVSRVCASLREPINIGEATFYLTPYAGVAILGQDAKSPKSLLDHARTAAAEARRSRSSHAHFFTDTLRLKSLARLDIARELRDAIANGDISLRYVGRHDLASGRLVARVGYLRWTHPLRGEVLPAEFLGVAEATGLAKTLSHAVLQTLRADFTTMTQHLDADVRISFGALRHHLMHEDFVDEIGRLLAEGAISAARLELRISERTFVALNPTVYKSLKRLGVQLVIDEVGRGSSSLGRLARAPIWGLQLDRAWVTALRRDEAARRVCRAAINAAEALGLTPIAAGVDDAEQRDALITLGCRQGSGDLYADAIPDLSRAQAS
jgi:EAL domain-containing protein (putative c-di-GMP-specific phosphodiesterase class I)/GGDEF domain-containing protein